MKRFKKIMALVIAMAMVLSMSMAAFAEDGDQQDGGTGDGGSTPAATTTYDQPLTVTGLTKGDTVKFYQVIKWVGEAEGNVAGWKAVDAYSSVLTEAVLKEVLVGTKADSSATPPVEAKDPTGITSELAGKLAALATGGVDGTLDAAGTTATLENAESGMWMALVTPTDANTVYNPVFVSADYNKEAAGTVAMTGSFADAVAKKSTLTLTKTAATTEDNWDDKKSDTTAVGDTVNFTVNTVIPGYGAVYTNPHFVIKDSLTALKLNKDSVTVTVPADLTKGTEYTVEATDTGYSITFSADYLKTLKTATDVTVTYNAIVTTDAANAVNEEDNEVSLEYSHNPNDQSDYDVKKDTTQHYTFSIDAAGIAEGESTVIKGKKTSEVVKIGVDAAGNPITQTTETSMIGDPQTDKWTGPLEGAVFGLFTDDKATVAYKAKNADGTVGTTAMTATTGTDGRMNFAGLDAGTYYLKEISAPAGFVTNSTIHKVEIIAETEEVTVTEWWNGSAWVSTKPASGTAKEVTYKTDILKSYTVKIDGNTAAEYTFTNTKETNSTEIQWENAELVEHPVPFENTQGVELPSTGGIGTTIFYVIGAMLVIGAGVIMITRRRMEY